MAGNTRRHNPVPVSDLVSGIIDPVLARRAGITSSLLQAWDEVVGDRLASQSRPEQIRWSRRADDDDPFEPATLVIACEAIAALHLQHETTEIIARVNAFLGYSAIGRIRIVQKPVSQSPKPSKKAKTLSPEQAASIARKVADVEDSGLREALERLGRNVVSSRK